MAKDYIIAKITAPRRRAIKTPNESGVLPRDEFGHQLTEAIEPSISFAILTPSDFEALKASRAKHGVVVEEAK